jgi:tRNA-(ms[2]io[6]A)-hydroxylase
MLSLQSETPRRWLDQVDRHLPDILIDHAHCEKKAAGTALNLMFAYVENADLCRAMTEIVNEELAHFQLVRELLDRRGIRFRRLVPSAYGRRLADLVEKNEPARAVDRLLIADTFKIVNSPTFTMACSSPKLGTIARTFGSPSNTLTRLLSNPALTSSRRLRPKSSRKAIPYPACTASNLRSKR